MLYRSGDSILPTPDPPPISYKGRFFIISVTDKVYKMDNSLIFSALDAFTFLLSKKPTPKSPPILDHSGLLVWTSEYPLAFRDQATALAGYTFQSGSINSPFVRGYFSAIVLKSYDFQNASGNKGNGSCHSRSFGKRYGHPLRRS